MPIFKTCCGVKIELDTSPKAIEETGFFLKQKVRFNFCVGKVIGVSKNGNVWFQPKFYSGLARAPHMSQLIPCY